LIKRLVSLSKVLTLILSFDTHYRFSLDRVLLDTSREGCRYLLPFI
jgi:hypothetical protein